IHAILDIEGIAYTAQQVATRDDYVSALGDHAFELILADYRLPGFDGMAALELAREACPEVPFILLSGVLGDELVVSALKRCASDWHRCAMRPTRYRPKPCPATRLTTPRRALSSTSRRWTACRSGTWSTGASPYRPACTWVGGSSTTPT